MEKVTNDYRLSYDSLTDTLYISVGSPSFANISEIDDDFVCVRKNNNEIVGVTIDGYLDRHQDGSWKDNLILKYIPNIKVDDIDMFISSLH